MIPFLIILFIIIYLFSRSSNNNEFKETTLPIKPLFVPKGTCDICGRTDSKYKWTSKLYTDKQFCTKTCLNKYHTLMEKPLCHFCKKRHGRKVWKSDDGKEFGSKNCMDNSLTRKLFSQISNERSETHNNNSIYNFKWKEKNSILSSRNDINQLEELISRIEYIDLPLRLNTDIDYDEKALKYILAINNYRRDSFRDIKFVVGGLKIDLIGSEMYDELYNEKDLFGDIESSIDEKQKYFYSKLGSSKRNYYTFDKSKKVDLTDFNPQESDTINNLFDEIKDWIKHNYLPERNKRDLAKIFVEDFDTIVKDKYGKDSHFLLWADGRHNLPNKKYFTEFKYNPIHVYYSKDLCLICRNSTEGLPRDYLFCLFCIELINLEVWDKKYKNKRVLKVNKDLHCCYKDCVEEAETGYFCNTHQKEIKKLGNLRKELLFQYKPNEWKKRRKGIKTYNTQPYKFNRLVLKKFSKGIKLNYKSLIDIIVSAPKDFHHQCYDLIFLLLVGSGKFKDAYNFVYDVLESYKLNDLKMIGRVGSAHCVIPFNSIGIIWNIIIKEKCKIHPFLAYKMLMENATYLEYNPSKLLEFRRTRFINNNEEEFVKILSEKVNLSRTEVSKHFPKNTTKSSLKTIVLERIDKLTESEYDDFRNDDKFLKKLRFRINSKYQLIDDTHNASKKEFTELMFQIGIDAENELRENYGIPKRGEGWVSETELFYLISKHFSNHEVVQHGRPSWLGRQHLDIYFPKLNIGVEYQGEQHFRPISFFGGEEAFKQNQERDRKKRELCEQNNCELIYVLPDYDIDTVIKIIDESLQTHY